jgi:hypothetical protein
MRGCGIFRVRTKPYWGHPRFISVIQGCVNRNTPGQQEVKNIVNIFSNVSNILMDLSFLLFIIFSTK